MSLEEIKNHCLELVKRLAFLEQEEIQSSGSQKYDYQQDIKKIKARLEYWRGLLDSKPTFLGDLPDDFCLDFLLDNNFKEKIIAQPVVISDLESDAECQVFFVHLIVAIFWEQRSKKKVRVQPEFYYPDPNTKQCIKESLAKDTCSLTLTEVPEMLDGLINFTSAKLSGIYGESTDPWKLTIEFFVPIDLLCFPLAPWCYQSSKAIQTHALTIRCSDRFDPNRPGESAILYNQLKAGWQRFQRDAPDQSKTKIKNLTWLETPKLGQENLENYSGLKCFGTWLKPRSKNQTSPERWEQVIRSGIPLALWICQGQSQPPIISQTYEQLTDCNRFEFLDRVRELLNKQLAIPNYHVGVFYEDPNYVPTVPITQEQQYFSWPGTA